MSAEPAVAAEIETTDAAPAADIAIDTTGAVGTDVAAANDPSSEAARADMAANEPSFEEAPKPLVDNTSTEDLYNDGGKGAQTGDHMAQKQLKEQAVPAEWNIGGNGGGPLGKETPTEKLAKKSEDLDAFISRIQDMHEQQEREREHAKKWDNETHDIAGTRMSGHDFMDMRAYLKSEQGRKKVQDELIRKGMSKEEAEKATKKADEYNDLMERVRRGEKLSPEEDARKQELQRDRDVKAAVQTSSVEAKKNGHEIKSVSELRKDSEASISSETSVIKSVSNLDNGVNNKAEQREGAVLNNNQEARAYFSGAPMLTAEFVRAGEATDPLDRKIESPNSPKITVAIAKQEVSATGLSL